MRNSIAALASAPRTLPLSIAGRPRRERKSASSGGSRLLHVAAASRILERFLSYPDHLVLVAHDFAQVNILDRIVRLGQRPRATWTFDVRFLERGDQFILLGDITTDGVQTGAQQNTGVVALYRIHIRFALVCL